MSVLKAIRYAYINAKVKAMQSKLLGAERILDLVEQPSVDAIAGVLEDTEYSRTVTKDVIETERLLKEKILEDIDKIRTGIPKQVQKFFDAFTKRYELECIKSFIRGLHFGLKKEEILKHIPSQYHGLFEDVESIEDLVSKYGLGEVFEEYRKTGDLQDVERKLDELYYKEVFENIPKRESDLYELLGREIDIKNIKLAVRHVLDKVGDKFIPIYGGYELSEWIFDEMKSSESLDRVAASLEGTSYYAPFVEALNYYKERGSLLLFEIKLDNIIYERAYDLSIKVPFGIVPIIAYIYLKEFEVANLRTIVKLKQENFSVEEIKENLRGIV